MAEQIPSQRAPMGVVVATLPRVRRHHERDDLGPQGRAVVRRTALLPARPTPRHGSDTMSDDLIAALVVVLYVGAVWSLARHRG